MINRKIGFIMMAFSIVAGLILFSYSNQLAKQSQQLSCNPNAECQKVESMLSISHISFGFISFIIALGLYLIFFNKDEEAILERLERERDTKLNEDKFAILMKAFDKNEIKVLKAIKEQEGVTQTTLRYRADLSKAKISEILTSFERRNLIKRMEKGKTYAVYLMENI